MWFVEHQLAMVSYVKWLAQKREIKIADSLRKTASFIWSNALQSLDRIRMLQNTALKLLAAASYEESNN